MESAHRNVEMELLPVMFKRELDANTIGMALGECVAHLNYLTRRGQLRRDTDDTGCYRYVSVDETLEQRLRLGGHEPDEAPMMV